MEFLFRLSMLAVTWVVIGGLCFGGILIWAMIRFSKICSFDDSALDERLAEFMNIATYNLFGFDKDDSVRKRNERIESFSHRPIGRSLIGVIIEWPKTLALVPPRFNEAFDVLTQKYCSK